MLELIWLAQVLLFGFWWRRVGKLEIGDLTESVKVWLVLFFGFLV